MNENLILIAENKIKDQNLTSQDARIQISRYANDNEAMILWCFSMLHKFNYFEARLFALDSIQKIINEHFSHIPINSIDHLLYEFFLSIYKDSNYNNVSLLNKISAIQTRLIKQLYPLEWPTAFDLEEDFSVMQFPDFIFYNFLKSFGQIARINQEIVKSMMDDGYSLKNILNRISQTIIKGSLDAKNSYLNCFKWADFHILVSLPCFTFILDDFSKVPNPSIAISILSTIFKQDKIKKDERIKFITDFKLFERFMHYLQTFSTIDEKSLNDFTLLICNIFETFIEDKVMVNFVPLFIETLTRLLKMNNYQKVNFKRLNDMFHGMIVSETINFSVIKEIYFPMMLNSLCNPKSESSQDATLLIDLYFSNILQKENLINEIRAFLNGFMQIKINKGEKDQEETSKFEHSFILLHNFALYSHIPQKYPTKIIMRETLSFLSSILDLEPSPELLDDPYYINSLKAYSDLFILSSIYFESKSFANIRVKDSLLFNRMFQCTYQGINIFLNSMFSLCQLENSSIVSLQNINDIIVFLITSLNIDMFKIATILIEKAPEEIANTIKNKSKDIILSRDSTLFSIPEIHLLFLLFSFQPINDSKEKVKEKKKKKSKKFTSFLAIPSDSQKCFEFFSKIFLCEEDQDGNPIPSNKFQKKDDYFEYVKMMVFLFGYRAFPFYNNGIINNPANHDISVITSIISILSTKYQTSNITQEVGQTNTFVVFFANNLLRHLFTIIDRDIKENSDDEPSEDLKNFSSFYSEFIKYIIHFIPAASEQIFAQILSIIENLFKYPILSSEALTMFFDLFAQKDDPRLLGLIYTSSTQLLMQTLEKTSIYPVNFKQCAISIFTFHHSIFHKNEDWGRSIIAPTSELLSESKLSFYKYVHLMESDNDQFCTELGKIINSFFRLDE